MSTLSEHEKRLIALEEKILYQEDVLQKLDVVIARQYDIIDVQTRRIKLLEEKVDELMLQKDNPSTPPPANEKPPHY